MSHQYIDISTDFKKVSDEFHKLTMYPADVWTWKHLAYYFKNLSVTAASIVEHQDLQAVTDLGNTTTNSITVNGVTSPYYLLDTTAAPTPQQGMLFWDEDRSTVGLQMNGVEARLGQDNFWYVKNQTGSPIPKGTAVMAVGALGASSRILVAPMVADGSVDEQYFLGITAEEILNGADGFVTNIGKIRGIDTSVYGTQAGQILYCDPANPGGFTITQPQAPNLNIPAAFTVDYKSNGTIAVRALPGYHLGELHDVYINTPSDQDILLYNGTNSRWENTPLASAVPTPTLDEVTTAGNTTTNDITVGGLTVNTDLIYTDTVNNRVGIGTSSPSYKLDIFGTGVSGGVSSNVGFNIQPVDPPNITGMTYTLLAGTNLSVGTYWYHIIYYNAIGETSRSASFQVDTTAGNQVVQLNNIPTSSNPSVIGRNIYRGKVGDGPSYGAKIGTITNNVDTTFVDSIPDSDPIIPSYILDRPIYAKANTTSKYISVFGVRSMIVDSIGLTTFGYQAGEDITSAGQTTLFGYKAGANITTRGGNTLFGYNAGSSITTGAQNVGMGDNVLRGITTGSYNVGLGPNVLGGDGSFNIAFGYYTGRYTTGNNNIMIGSYIGSSTLSMSSSIIIGHNATPLASTNNQINIGNTIYGRSNTGNVLIGTTTDAGYKLDVNGTARIQGDLTVDTNTLFVDAANDRVGIGTNVPSQALQVGALSTSNTKIQVVSDAFSTTSGLELVRGSSTWNIINNGNFTIQRGGSTFLTVNALGNVLINTTTDAGYKLDVNGSARLNGLTSINRTSVANTALAIGANGTGAGNFIIQGYDISSNQRFYLTASGNFRINGAADNGASGHDEKFRLNQTFNPTSGTRTHYGMWLRQTINQTGGANGITRGLYINPTLTSAADYRAIETTSGNVIFNGGNVGIGVATPSYRFHLVDGNSAVGGSYNSPFYISLSRSSSGGSPLATYFTQELFNLSGTDTFGNSLGKQIYGNINNTGNSTYRNLMSRVHTLGSGGANHIALYSTQFEGRGTGTINNFYGAVIGGSAISGFSNVNSTITNTYGLYFGSLTSGTQTNAPYAIYQSGTEKNYFGGNVLIGTITDAGYKLDVNGPVRFGDGTPYLQVTSGAVVVDGSYLFANRPSGVSFYAYESVFRGLIHSDSTGGNVLKLGDTQERMRITGGNVGIGTSSPNRNLDVQGTDNTVISVVAPTDKLSQLALGDTDDDNYAQLILDNATNKLQIQNGGGSIISDRGITLDSSENVGIGISSPAAKLQVNGTSGDTDIRLVTAGETKARLGFYEATDYRWGGYIQYNGSGDRMEIGHIRNYNVLTPGMTIVYDSNNVLINTTTDSGLYRLDVNGSFRASGDLGGTLTVNSNLNFATSSGTNLNFEYGISLVTPIGYGLVVNSWGLLDNTDRLTIGEGISEYINVYTTTGNVGVGTFIDNGYKLEVNGTVSAQLTNATHTEQVYYNTTTGELTYGSAPSTSTLDEVTSAGNTTTNSLVVGGLTVDTDTLYVDSANDRVGVGTTSPSYTLDVGGTIRTTGTAFFDNNVSIGTTSTGYTLRVNGNMLAGGMQFQDNIINASNVTISTITNGGNGNVNMRFFDGAWRDVLFFSNYQYGKNLILCGTGTYTGYNTIVGGTTNDGNKFQVKGGASVTGDLTLGGDIIASSLTSAEGASLLYYDSSTGAVSQSVDPMHNWEWKWIRYSGAVNPAGSTSTNFTDWYNTYFLRPTEATNTTYPIAASGYINTKTNVAADGGFGGSGVGNLSGDLNYYHALIFTHIYVEESFTISATLIGDDPFAMFINGIFVTGRTSCCTGMPYTYTFSPGWYRIDLIYSENVGGDYIKMGWNPADYLDKIKYMNPHHIGQLTSYTFDEVNLATLNATSSIKLSTGDATTPAKLSINNPSGNNSTGTSELHFTHSNNLNGAKIVGGRDNVYGGASGTWRGNLQFFTSTFTGGYNSDPAMRIDVFDNIVTYAGVFRIGTSSNSGEKLQVSGTAKITSNTSIGGLLTATAGAKLVVQNGTDGGNSRGILLWTNTDTNWGIYMGQAGSGKSLSGGTATASIDGRTSHAARFRVSDSTTHSFIWENRQEIALMSLTGDTGNLYTRGGAYFGTNSGNVTIGSTTNAGYKLDVNGSINSSTGYHINGVQGYTGTVNIDQSHIGLPPIQIEINGGIITNVI